jgi:hypothetical protein
LNRKKISWNLRIRIHDYLKYQNTVDFQKSNDEEDKVLAKLSSSLRENILNEVNR